MKRIFTICIWSALLLYPFFMVAQQQPYDTYSADLLRALRDTGNTSFPVIITGNRSDILSALSTQGKKAVRIYPEGVRVTLNRAELALLRHAPGIERIECPMGKKKLLNDAMLVQNNADSAHAGLWPLSASYEGEGIVVGIIDAPFDYRHLDFTDEAGQTRIKYLWDQALPDDGTAPEPYGYGIECDSQSIADETCPHVDETFWYSHGSGVAGVAASSGEAASAYKGIAPKADLIFVSLDFESDFLASVIDAIDYVFTKADEMGKPCVVNTSFGVYSGTHDARDITAQTIESMLEEKPGRVIVAAAGNAGNQLIHLGYEVTETPQFTWFRKLSYTNLVYWQLWADTAELNDVYFSVAADLPTGWVSKGTSPYWNIQNDFDTEWGTDSLQYTLIHEGSTIGQIYFYAAETDGVYMLECYIIPSVSTHYWRLTTMGSGYFDLWGLEGFTGFSNFVTTGLPSSGIFPDIVNYRLPDSDQSLVSSWQCSDKVITVGSYVNRDTMTNYYGVMPPLVDTVGQLFYSSSKGPTRDGRIKPDITSTGSRVLTTASSVLTDWLIGLGAANYISEDGQHYLQNGTSFASPAVSGIAALYLEKNAEAGYDDFKTALLQQARRDSFTGTELPDNRWGYGKADAFRTLTGPWGCTEDSYTMAPTGLQVAETTATAAYLIWDLVPAASRYQLAVAAPGLPIQRRNALSNSRTLTGLTPGTTYSVKARTYCDTYGWSFWSVPVLFTTEMMRDARETDWLVYPNPAVDYFYVQLPPGSYTLNLYNLQGQQVHHLPEVISGVRISTEGIPAGVYHLVVQNTLLQYQTSLLIEK